MFSKVCGIGLLGVEGCLVHVEADAQDGLPGFAMVGALAPEVREAQDRVRTALKNAGFRFPPKKVTVNLSPAGIHKSGTGFDLPIAAAILGAYGELDWESLADAVLIGEMGLDGVVKPVRGILPMVIEAKNCGKTVCYLPEENVREGQMIPGLRIVGIGHIRDLIARAGCEEAADGDEPGHDDGCADATGRDEPGEGIGNRARNDAPGKDADCGREGAEVHFPYVVNTYDVDYRDVQGQWLMKRATEVAVAGRHNLLYIGPAGTGKTMIAERIPTIMPSCTMEEMLEISKIYSICGMLPKEQPFMTRRPFRCPHHSATAQALTGGGRSPMPGEMSLASGGVLFLDELPEFSRNAIELLRQPLESHRIVLSRVSGRYEFPADFMLVAAANPCPCGHFPDRNRCRCSEEQIRRYFGKISKPILDRIDICTEAAPVDFKDLRGRRKEESSERIRERVERVRRIQKERFAGRGIRFNSQMTGEDIRVFCSLSREEEEFFREVYQRKGLSARAYSKILKVARTIADLDGAERIGRSHLSEAIGYRSLEEKYRQIPEAYERQKASDRSGEAVQAQKAGPAGNDARRQESGRYEDIGLQQADPRGCDAQQETLSDRHDARRKKAGPDRNDARRQESDRNEYIGHDARRKKDRPDGGDAL